MRKRPLALFISALLFAYFPLDMVWGWYHHRPISVLDILISGILPLLLIVGLLKVTKVGWYTLIATIALGGVRDLYEFYATRDSTGMSLLVNLAIYAISLGYFINPRIRHLYFDPRLRWWRTKLRYETHLPFILTHRTDWHYPILRNVSDGGCFVETPHSFDVGTHVGVTIPLPVPLEVSVIRTEGEVRWVSTNPLRVGMGVQFKNPPRRQVKALRQFVQKQL